MTAIGIDLGGTKIETQVFDDAWSVINTQRVDTPDTYDALIGALRRAALWADGQAGRTVPIGIGAAGRINPSDGTILAANHAAHGKPLPAEISTSLGRTVTYLNDAQALALSEAVFGAGKNHDTVASLVLGTGVGGGVVHAGKLGHSQTGTGGEFGHTAAPAHLIQQYGLPILACGCGRTGCIETLISGPGLSQIAKTRSGRNLSPADIAASRATDAQLQDIWNVWCALTAEVLHMLTLALDPDCIVIGGGLSKIPGILPDLSAAHQDAQLRGFPTPPLFLAQGGDASGARGAAYAAQQAMDPITR
jgi:N-acetylglucosamine kinase